MDACRIQTRQIVGKSSGAVLLITGGIHGDEYEPMSAVRRLMALIDPAELRGRLVLAPVVNEPAFARRSRCADDGKDLARTFPGSPCGTITERIAHAVAGLIRQADYYIDLHTGGGVASIYPMAGYMLHANADVLAMQRRIARAFNLPIIWGTDGTLTGRSLSEARDANVPAIYAEYGGGGSWCADAVDAFVEGCLNVMVELDMIDRSLPRLRTKYIVEDSRPGSGYLQIQNPSPSAGCFEPAVAVGQMVRPGDHLGDVCDVIGDRVHRIESCEEGLVLMLRTCPRVERGDALAVVLDLAGQQGGVATASLKGRADG